MFEQGRINARIGIDQKIVGRKLLNGIVLKHHFIDLRELFGHFLQGHVYPLIELPLPQIERPPHPIHLRDDNADDGNCGQDN